MWRAAFLLVSSLLILLFVMCCFYVIECDFVFEGGGEESGLGTEV